MSQNSLSIHLAWFETATPPHGPAIGSAETLAWADFVSIVCDYRRVGAKDTICFAPTRFHREEESLVAVQSPYPHVGEHRYRVHRVARNAVARTAIALDIEADKTTGEIPPPPSVVAQRLKEMGTAAVIYTSHSHQPEMPRYRVVPPLSGEVDPLLPVCEIFATKLGLDGVLDRSKIGPAGVFYLPTCASEDLLGQHEALAVDGHAVDAEWITVQAAALQAKRDAEQERIAAEAHAAASQRLQARIAAGFVSDDSLIERLRSHLDLAQILAAHGYDKLAGKWRHANSTSGLYGANIKVFGGIERIFSHNASDPLHASNLPDWCTVTAIDAVDATIILDYGGDRTLALREMSERFGLSKSEEWKQLAHLIFQLRRLDASQEAIEGAVLAEGRRLGLAHDEVCRVVLWVNAQNAAAAA